MVGSDDFEAWPGLELASRAFAPFFETRRQPIGAVGPVHLARAPGRLDVMGGIADYSGSLVLELPLRDATFALVEPIDSNLLQLVSTGDHEPVDLVLEALCEMSYEEARVFFRARPERSWAGYVAGAFVVLAREEGARFRRGARIALHSDLPAGKGVASSAALEVAAMSAVGAAYELEIDPYRLAKLCQIVENEVVGAPCGIMDQMTAVFGEEDRLLAILCRPDVIEGAVPVPEKLRLWGIDSGIRHAVSGNDYRSVRVAAFMGLEMVRDFTGREVAHLAELTPAELENFRERLPERSSGAEFLKTYGAGIDEVTTVDPSTTYAVRDATVHPVLEHDRIRAFRRLLGGEPHESPEQLGELMYESHASYSACGLGSEGTDRLVELAREAGPERGVYGAKITGGGSGGTVAILGSRDAGAAVEAIATLYASETGRETRIFEGSSSGAKSFGRRRWTG